MFLVQTTYRAHSSGEESTSRSVFQTLEEAVSYITNDWYNGICADYEYPEVWDAEDMHMPFPTKEEFAKSVNEKTANIKRSLELFAPRSDYCALVPIELNLHKVK